MKQPKPSATAADVERIVRRDFGAEMASEVHTILLAFGAESWHRETDRVRLAALKLAGGDLSQLRGEIEAASIDYRDTLAAAESPASRAL